MLLSHTPCSHMLAVCKACFKGRDIRELEKSLLREKSMSIFLVVRALEELCYHSLAES